MDGNLTISDETVRRVPPPAAHTLILARPDLYRAQSGLLAICFQITEEMTTTHHADVRFLSRGK